MMTDQNPLEQHAADPSPVVTDYLAQLRHLAMTRLPADQAGELVDDVTLHLREVGSGAGEAELRNAIDRLGTPTELVDAAAGAPVAGSPIGGMTQTGTIQTGARSDGRLESAALICLVASVVLFIFWPVSWPLLIAGLIMLAISRHWSLADKILGFVAYGVFGAPGLLIAGLGAFLMVSSVESCAGGTDASGTPVGDATCTTSSSGPAWVGWVYLAVTIAVLVAVTIRLARHRRGPVPA